MRVPELVARFRALMPLYAGGHVVRLPCDLESARTHAHRSAVMFEAEPAFLQISVQLQCPYAKDMLLLKWNAMGRPGMHQGRYLRCNAARAQSIRAIRIELAKACDGVNMDAFIDNCGSSHVLGPVAVLLRLHILRKSAPMMRRTALHVGKRCESNYFIDESKVGINTSLRRLERPWRVAQLHEEGVQLPKDFDHRCKRNLAGLVPFESTLAQVSVHEALDIAIALCRIRQAVPDGRLNVHGVQGCVP